MKTDAIRNALGTLGFTHDVSEAMGQLRALEEAHEHMARALHHVMEASVNERVWNEGAERVDDMKAICRAALKKAGALP